MTEPRISEEIQQLLKKVADTFDKEDRAVRERQIRLWRRLKLYWNGFQNVYWSEVAHDWRIYDAEQVDNTDQSYYDKPFNVFRALLESVIAALSISIPGIRCYPDDADNPLDISTAKAGDKIAELVYKHNNIPLVFINSLYVYVTEGMVACYSYPKEDDKYGTYEENEYEDELTDAYICPNCEMQVPDEAMSALETDEYMPGDDDIMVQNELQQGPLCPTCLAILDPSLQKSPLIVQKLVGITRKPKSRQCIEVYGGLYVKIPNYVKRQEDMPYLRFSYETHYSNVLEKYENLRDKISGSNKIGPNSSGVYDPYEAWGRLSTQYNGEYPINTVTVNNYWFRPSAFNVLNKEEGDKLRKKFPSGCKYVKVNECYAHAENEDLDDCWTITQNPLSDYLYFDPPGLFLTSTQDIINDLISLTIQTIEHGIPQTFADPGVLNFNQYRQTETTPGSIYPATAKAGKTVGDGFYEVKTSTLSGEILPFFQQVLELGQLISAAMPVLYGGGGTPNSSKTASGEAMSRNMALQRLQTPWKMFSIWWKTIFGKVIPAYIKEMVEDERLVEKTENNNFVNVFIRKAEAQGKIGSVELEAAENLPVTWTQKKDTIMQIMQAANPEILQALLSPENIPFIAEAIGLNEFVMPGEDDRTKQYEEIQQLLATQPIALPSIDPMSGMPTEQEVPSVEVDPDVDNHQIEADICRHWLIGDAGRAAKGENPLGYKNVLLHMKMHMQIMAQQMMAQAMMQAPPAESAGSNGGRPNPEGGRTNQSAAAPQENENGAAGTQSPVH